MNTENDELVNKIKNELSNGNQIIVYDNALLYSNLQLIEELIPDLILDGKLFKNCNELKNTICDAFSADKFFDLSNISLSENKIVVIENYNIMTNRMNQEDFVEWTCALRNVMENSPSLLFILLNGDKKTDKTFLTNLELIFRLIPFDN